MDTIISTILFITHLSLGICNQAVIVSDECHQNYLHTESEEVMQSDFEWVGGLIDVDTELNGVAQKNILDIDSEHLIINYKKKNLCKWELKTKYKEPLNIALSKNKVKLTKSLFYRN